MIWLCWKIKKIFFENIHNGGFKWDLLLLGDTKKSSLARPNNLFKQKQIHWKCNEAIWYGVKSMYEPPLWPIANFQKM